MRCLLRATTVVPCDVSRLRKSSAGIQPRVFDGFAGGTGYATSGRRDHQPTPSRRGSPIGTGGRRSVRSTRWREFATNSAVMTFQDGAVMVATWLIPPTS